MLSRILALLDAQGAMTVDELVRATGASREALAGMLDTLERRRLVARHRSVAGASCGSCQAGAERTDREALTVTLALPTKNRAPGEAGGEGAAKTRGR